jgi:uncharacterized tellurite resistance protein B-like protein
MLRTLKEFFDQFTTSAPDPAAALQTRQLAAAVLLVEIMRVEPDAGPAEREAVMNALRHRFALTDEALQGLLQRAQAEAQGLYDYHRFTSVLNEQCTQPQKIALVEAMWTVAYADQQVEANEHHAISKIAGLLHVTHGEYIGAKLRAKEAAGLA